MKLFCLLAFLPLLAVAQPVAISTLSTNAYTNIVSVLSQAPVETPCPECGGPNHHDRRVALMEVSTMVSAEIVAGGQTNHTVVWRSPKSSVVVTNLVLRTRSQPGWTLPPAPGPLDPANYTMTNRVLTNITPIKP